jgi:hypothetical protein
LIASYVLLFGSLGAIAWTQTRRLRVAGLVVIAAGLGAGLCDVFENLALFSQLGSAPPHTLARPWSLIKWALFFTAIGFTVPLLIDRQTKAFRRWLGHATCVLAAFTFMDGSYGLVSEMWPDAANYAVPTYSPATQTTWLDQHWTRDQRDWFHHVDQGTQTFRIP